MSRLLGSQGKGVELERPPPSGQAGCRQPTTPGPACPCQSPAALAPTPNGSVRHSYGRLQVSCQSKVARAATAGGQSSSTRTASLWCKRPGSARELAKKCSHTSTASPSPPPAAARTAPQPLPSGLIRTVYRMPPPSPVRPCLANGEIFPRENNPEELG